MGVGVALASKIIAEFRAFSRVNLPTEEPVAAAGNPLTVIKPPASQKMGVPLLLAPIDPTGFNGSVISSED